MGRRRPQRSLDRRAAAGIAAYLERHAEPDSDLAGAEPVLAELLSNAFEHAPGPAWVRATWNGESPRLEVHDLGPGFVLDPRLSEPDSERGRGLFIVDAIADDLRRASKAAGGSAVSAAAGARTGRRATPSRPSPIPEARPDGTFGREAVLRALLVELAQTVEGDQGPDVAAAVIAQVDADVGGRWRTRTARPTASPAGRSPRRSSSARRRSNATARTSCSSRACATAWP